MWIVIPFIGGIWDGFTGEIPDWITIPLITLGILYSLLYDWSMLWIYGIMGGLGFILYRNGIVGGGDILLLMTLIPFVGISAFFILFGAFMLTAIFYGVYLAVVEKEKMAILIPLLPPLFASFLALFLLSKADRSRFVKEIDVSDLEEEDILAELPEGWKKRVIERGDKEKLKDLGVEKVKIYVNLPRMGPFIALISLLVFLEVHPQLLTYIPPFCLLWCN